MCLLTGQRRMGKTSIVRELGRRLESEGWVFLFVDVEGASLRGGCNRRHRAGGAPRFDRSHRASP